MYGFTEIEPTLSRGCCAGPDAYRLAGQFRAIARSSRPSTCPSQQDTFRSIQSTDRLAAFASTSRRPSPSGVVYVSSSGAGQILHLKVKLRSDEYCKSCRQKRRVPSDKVLEATFGFRVLSWVLRKC